MHTHRDLRARLILVTVMLVIYVFSLAFLGWRISTPSDMTRLGFQSKGHRPDVVDIDPILPHRSNLHIDDQLIAINDIPMTEWASFDNGDIYPNPAWQIGDTLIYTVIRDGERIDIPVTLDAYPIMTVIRENAFTLVFLVMMQVGALWVWSRRPDIRETQILLLASTSLTAFSLFWLPGMDAVNFIMSRGIWLYYRISSLVLFITIFSTLLHFTFLLTHTPNNSGIKRRTVLMIYLIPYLINNAFLVVTYSSEILVWLRMWEYVIWLIVAIYFIWATANIMLNYSQIEDQLARKRVEVTMIAYAISIFLALLIGWMPTWLFGNVTVMWRNTLPLLAIPICIGMLVSIVIFRLFDIKIVMQRAIISTALTFLIILFYVGAVGILGVIFQRTDNQFFTLMAIGVTALMIHPVRMWLQNGVNNLIYGQRDTPYKVINELTGKLGSAMAPQKALDIIVETLGETLRLSYVAIELSQSDSDSYVLAAECGDADWVSRDEWVAFPLKYGGESCGQLIVAPRNSGDPLTLGDLRLISGLVHEAEVTIQAVRLNADLRRSREHLITAREEERRRLRRELHDRLGPTLASLTLHIDAARNLLRVDKIDKTDEILTDLKIQIQTAVADVRRLAYSLRPPILDELGLIPALKERAHQSDQNGEPKITIVASDLPPLSAALEGAIYQIAIESINNAMRHARATVCEIQLYINEDGLCLNVYDNGQGLPENFRQGVGIQSMKERAAEIGGCLTISNRDCNGTLVTVIFPLSLLETDPYASLEKETTHG